MIHIKFEEIGLKNGKYAKIDEIILEEAEKIKNNYFEHPFKGISDRVNRVLISENFTRSRDIVQGSRYIQSIQFLC